MEPSLPVAAAVAVRDGRFLFVGDESGAAAALGACPRRVDLKGRCVLPGLTDSHLHFRWYAESLRAVDVETPTLEEAAARLADRATAAEPGAWITGSGWNHNVWGAGSLPDSRPLDRVAPRNPVALKAKSGHALWVNSLALERAGIGLDTPDPASGTIVHGSDGMPTGILLENAMDLVQSIIPVPSAAECAQWMLQAQDVVHRLGLTGIHDFDGTLAVRAFIDLEASGELALRVTKGIPHESLSAAIAMGIRSGFGGERLRFGQLKMFADGALGPQTAWMIAPYEATWSTGIPTLTEEQLCEDIRRANAAGIACAVHAIGDAACHAVLDAYEQAAGDDGANAVAHGAAARTAATPGGAPRGRVGTRAGLPNRIEHCQLLHPDDLPRLARLGIVASMQPIHGTSDMLIAERHWGSRCRSAYAWRSLLDLGTALAFGSDCPVESPDPMRGIHAAVTRRREDGSPGPEGWRPEQRLSVEQAVRAFTMGPAFAAGREGELGSIAPGKLADLTILDNDIFSIDSHEIRHVRAAATVVGGVFVHGSL